MGRELYAEYKDLLPEKLKDYNKNDFYVNSLPDFSDIPKKEKIIEKFLMHTPVKFDVADGEIKLHGAIFEYDTDKKRTVSARLFEY